MMKYIVAACAAMMVAAGAQAGSLNLYGGLAQVGSESISQAGVVGGSGAALAGIAGTSANAGTVSGGFAGANIDETGADVAQGSGTVSSGNSTSAALGLAGAASGFGAVGGAQSGAEAVFGTVGLGFNP